ncbi:MAG: PQQ-dependent sugar dehydrogenase, partial [Gammaproteobacteria bacterium]|nr:PQQ-dependent sugar dehydrogenase [Gammaproteobacteria bacterium]
RNDAMRNAGSRGAILLLGRLAGYSHAQTTFLEEGFTLELVTDDVPAARQIAEAPDGTLFVGSSSNCERTTNVFAVVPGNDGSVEVVTVGRSLRCPSGVALRGDDLYVAALNRVLRYPDIMDTFRNDPDPEVVADDLPAHPHHGWKYLAFGPDGYLYVPVGAPCNVCDESDQRYATILRMDPDTGVATVYAHGVRNSVGMVWHPVTGELWFSENGRDLSGDDLPADEINRVQTPGGHYGFPYFHQDHRPGEPIDYRDPGFGGGKNAADYLRSEHLIQAHSAALGITFYNGDQFPSHYCGAMFIAEHGSWNRYAAGKAGYRVSVLRFAHADSPAGARAVYERFIEWQVQHTHQPHRGRPNDVLVARDGSLLIADDQRGRIYRVRYNSPDGDTTPTGCADAAHISTFAPKSHETRQGFARVVNHSETAATIQVDAFDDAGQRHGPVTLTVGAGEIRHFNSADLEDGNEDKGLSGKTGPGTADWRIELRGDGLEVLSYMRTDDGFVTSLHDTAALLAPATVIDNDDGTRSYEYRYDVPIFNPGRNINQVSTLRLVNPGDVAAEVRVTGIDDRAMSGETAAVLTLEAGASRFLSAAHLESGEGLRDAQGLGTGTGKWRLEVTSDRPILVASLLASPTGHLTNLSTVPDNKVSDGASTSHYVPLFPAHGDAKDRQGFVRIVNRSDNAGSIEIRAHDDTDQEFGTLSLNLDANRSIHFNSEHLEQGDDAKGWAEGIGAGEGDWRLTLTSERDIDVLAYIRRTDDGFLTSMHDFVRRTGTDTYEVAFFNPGRNTNQVSRLRILNTGEEDATVTITGTDDRGNPSSGTVGLTVPAGAVRSFTAQELEARNDDFTGMLGTGSAKWRLTVESERPIRVMSLLENQATGHLTNLSTVGANQPWQWDQ